MIFVIPVYDVVVIIASHGQELRLRSPSTRLLREFLIDKPVIFLRNYVQISCGAATLIVEMGIGDWDSQDILNRILSQAKVPLKDVASVNSTRWLSS